jgi:hypothetical protein
LSLLMNEWVDPFYTFFFLAIHPDPMSFHCADSSTFWQA